MSQATLVERPYVNSNLFSGHYLDERVSDRDEWDCDEAAAQAFDEIQSLYELEGDLVDGYGEDALIDNWIDEVLDSLGYGTQAEVTLPDGGGYVDELLFETQTSRREAASIYLDTEDTTDLFDQGIGILEAKQWDADFTRRFHEQRPYRNASHQIKHYLENTPENIQWGILTNGRKWRLYGTKDYETQTYYEVDLPELIARGNLEEFKYFYVFFRPEAFRESGGTTFLDDVWSESETASQELGEDLQDNVFTALRVLGRGFVETNDLDIDPGDQESLDELKDQSLVLLYRLMFVLYSEARGLIHPKGQAAQEEFRENFSLDALRLEVHETIGEVDEGFEDEFSEHSTSFWSRLEDLFRLIDQGEESLGIPPYNGGLFDNDSHEFLTENEVSNRYLAEVIYRLSTTKNDDGRYVLADYGDLDTRHLGTVYEGLLEHQFRIAPEQYTAVEDNGGQIWKSASEVTEADTVETVPEGGLYVVNDEGERKATGAYYTPDYVVMYIVEETVGPLVEEIREDLIDQGFEPGTQEYLGPFLQRITDLRILDPAMGSGHFLTTATGYLSERVMAEVRDVEEEIGVAFDEQHVRREIAKECIYGVDLNGMAVELAKLSMWLETLAADRPLAFLDHHFKTGNSLVGSDIEEIEELESDATGDDGQYSLAEFGATREGTIERLMDIYSEFLSIENETVEDVQKMKLKYAEIEQDELRQRLVSMASVHTAEHFDLDIPNGVYEHMAKALEDDAEWNKITEKDWFKSAQQLADTYGFFHWKLEFPETFYDENGYLLEEPGFDVVIGNPPYVSNWELTESDENLPSFIESLYPEVTVGHWDLFVPFCYKAISLTNKSGYHSFITPNSLALEKYGRELRKYMINNCSLRKLVDFEAYRVFEDVDRQYLVYILNPKDDIETGCSVVRYHHGSFQTMYSVESTDFLQYENSTFRIDISPLDMDLKDKIENRSIKLGHLCCVNPGVVAHSAKDSPLDFDKGDVIVEKPSTNAVKYVSGSDIARHRISWNGHYMEYYKHQNHFHRPKFPELFESPKIMFSGISSENNGIKSVFDDSGYYTNHNINHATTWTSEIRQHHSSADYEISEDADQYNIKYISAIVNSKLVAYYFSNFLATGTLQGSYSSMYPEHIRQLPIKNIQSSILATLSNNESKCVDSISNYINNTVGAQTVLKEITEHNADNDELLSQSLIYLLTEIRAANDNQASLSLDLLDYLGNYNEGPTLANLGTYQSPPGVGGSKLVATTDQYENLRLGGVSCERADGNTIILSATARFKPQDEESYETDQWGYTETEPIPAMRLSDLSETESDLVEAFVPIAVDEAGGFANFRETATKTNSLVDRLEVLTLPDPDDVADDIDRYMDTVKRSEELDEKIQRIDGLIDEIVYELYGLTDEEIEIVEQSLTDD